MPTIICTFCQYVGSGQDYDEKIADVEAHEEFCSERLVNIEADAIDAAYEQARADGKIDFNKKAP